MDTPNLKSVTKWLYNDYGYVSYLLGKVNLMNRREFQQTSDTEEIQQISNRNTRNTNLTKFHENSKISVNKATTSSHNDAIVLIPLSGAFWDDALEIGRSPLALGKPFTWHDFVSVAEGGEVHEWLLDVGGSVWDGFRI